MRESKSEWRVPYGNRTRVGAVKENRFTGIQKKPAAWMRGYRDPGLIAVGVMLRSHETRGNSSCNR